MSPPKKRPAVPEPTQTTEKGLKMPIPTRDAFLRNLEKVAPEAGGK